MVPSGQPTGQPSAQPVTNPTGQPTSAPSTSFPTGQPSSSPTSQPTVQPTTLPSGQPTGIPTAIPTGQPTSRPTTSSPLPEGQRASAPPTYDPSSSPTGAPTSAPTSQPTTSPGTLITTRLQEMLSNYTSALVASSGGNRELDSYASFRRVSQRPTDSSAPYDHAVDDAVVEGGCVDWIEYWKGGALEEQLYGGSPDIISVFVVHASTPAGALEAQLTDPRNATCTETGKPQLIVEQLTQTAVTVSSSPIECDNRQWVINPCGDSQSPTLCIDCSAAMVASMCNTTAANQNLNGDVCDIGDDDDYADDSGAIYIGPCQQSLCTLRRAHSMGHLLVSRGKSSSPPPVLLNSTSVRTSKNSITIEAQVDEEGVLVCDAFTAPAGDEGGPSNVNQVLLTGVSAAVVFNVTSNTYGAAIVIEDLSAATTYYPYCATKSQLDVSISFEDMVQQAEDAPSMRNVTTQCCREVTLNFQYNSISGGTDTALFEDVMSVEVESVPAASLTATFSLISATTGITYDVFAPGNKVYSSQSSSAQLTSTTGLYISTASDGSTGVNRVPSGNYYVEASLAGSAASMYSLVYESGNRNVSVISVDGGGGPPVPELSRVVFSEDGTFIRATFTSATDRAGQKGDFPCSKLFVFTSASSSVCSFKSSTVVLVYTPDLDADISLPVPGSSFSVKNDTVKAECTRAAGCSDWAYSNPATVTGLGLGLSTTMQAPPLPATPVVVVSSPKRIGNCDSFTISLTSSTGNAGRDWASTNFSVTSTDSTMNSHNDISDWLGTSYIMAPPNAISNSLMVAGNMYSVTVTMCNFLGSCGVTTHSWTIVRRAKPQVTILGANLRSITRSDKLDLTAGATILACNEGSGATATSASLTYAWQVTDMSDGSLLPDLVKANRARSASRFTLSPYTLSTGQSIEVEVKVYSKSEGTSSYYSVAVEVVAGEVVARITDFSDRLNIIPRKTLAIDASASYDDDSEYLYRLHSGAAEPDSEGRKSMLAKLTFTWSCVTVSPVYQAGCASYLLLSNYSSTDTPWVLSVYAHSAVESTRSKITLVVADPLSTRSSKISLSLYGLTSGSPTLRVFKRSKGKGSSDLLDGRRKVKLAAVVRAPDFSEVDIDKAEGELTWSVDRSSGLSLRQSALSPLTKTIILTPLVTEQKVDLVLRPESLGGTRDYTFYLSYTGTTGVFVESSVTVEANRPPAMGRVAARPAVGSELDTEFTIIAYLWTDSDLPLTYEPFLAHPTRKDLNVVLQTRSDKTSVVTKLPGRSVESSGDSNGVPTIETSGGDNTTQRIGLRVFDSLGAFTRKFTSVTIVPRVIPDREVSEYIEDSILNAATPDDAKAATVTASLQINKVDCSKAPNCTKLNREDCSSQPHTCGVCFEDYLGTTGYHNSRCASAALFLSDYTTSTGDDDYYFDDDDSLRRGRELLATPVRVVWAPRRTSNYSGPSNFTEAVPIYLKAESSSRDLSMSCLEHADCEALGPWHACSANGVCDVPLAPCPNDCSGNGYCEYRDSRNEELLSACYVGDATCKAGCVCNMAWYGPACLINEISLYDRMQSRLTILRAMQYLISNDELTVENVVGWTELIILSADAPSELSPASIELVSKLTSAILEAAGVVNDAIVTTTVGEEEDDSSTVGYENMVAMLKLMSAISDMRDQRVSPYGGRTDYPTSQPTSFMRRELDERDIEATEEPTPVFVAGTTEYRKYLEHLVCAEAIRESGKSLFHFDWSGFNVSMKVKEYLRQHLPQTQVLHAPRRRHPLMMPPSSTTGEEVGRRVLVELSTVEDISAVGIDPKEEAKAFSESLADMALDVLTPGEDGISSAYDNLRVTVQSLNTFTSVSTTMDSSDSASRSRLLQDLRERRRLSSEASFLSLGEDDYIFVESAASDTELLSGGNVNYVAVVGLSSSSDIGSDSDSTLEALLMATPAHLINTSAVIIDAYRSAVSTATSVPTPVPTVAPQKANGSSNSDNSSDNFSYLNFIGDFSIASSSLDFRLNCDAGGFSAVSVYFTLYHDTELALYNQSHGEVSRLNFTTVCKRKHPSVHEYLCPDSNDVVTAVCTGRRETIVTYCPQIERISHCASVNPSTGVVDASTGNSSCAKQEALSNGNVTVCKCTMCGSARRRRLSDSSETLDELELTTLVTYSATDVEMAIVEMSTSTSSDDSIAGMYPVLVAFICVWLLFPALTWLHRSRVQQTRKIVKRKQENRIAPDAGYGSEGKDGSDQALTTVDGIRISQDGNERAGGDGQQQVIEAFGAYVTSVIPDVFAAPAPQRGPHSLSFLARLASPFSVPKKMWDELSQHHIYGSIVSSEDPGKALTKLAHVLTAATVALFLLAILFDLQFPDNTRSTCEAHSSEADCLAEAGFLDNSYHPCKWDSEYRECAALTELDVPHTTYLVLTIWFCILVVPLLLLQEYLFTHILAAPTAADLDQRERKAFLYSALKLVKAVKPDASLDKYEGDLMQEFDRYGDKDGSTDLGSQVTEKSVVPEHYHAVLLEDIHHSAQHHLKQGRLHAKTRHKKLQHRNEKMVKLVKRQREKQRGAEEGNGDGPGANCDHERERMVSRAVLTSMQTQHLRVSLSRAINISLLARTQIDAVRKRYLSQQALHYLKYEEEKKSALKQQRQAKFLSKNLDISGISGATDGSLITARRSRNYPDLPALEEDAAENSPPTELDDNSINTAPIYGPNLDSELEANTTSGENLRNASLALTNPSEGPVAEEEEETSDDSLGSWASDNTNIHDDTALKKRRRARRKELALLKEKLRPDVMAHLRSSTRMERFQQRRALLHHEALSLNKQFHRDLLRHRNSLRYREQVRELDEQWTLTAIDTGATGRGMNAGLGVKTKKGENKYCFDAKAELVMAAEIENSLKGAGESLSLLRSLPPSLRGPELLRLFVLDLLGRDTMAAKVMKTKMYANSHFHVVSHAAKVATGITVALANLVMMYTALSLASSKSEAWQRAWMFTVGANIAVHLGLNQVMEALLLHYYIPQLVFKEAQAVRRKLLDIVDTLFRDTLIGDGAGEAGSGGVFSHTSFFFVSHHVANQSPELHEAALVLSHRDALPLPSLRQKWLSPADVERSFKSGVGSTDSAKKSRYLSSKEIEQIAIHRLHETYLTDQARTLTGRLYLARQIVNLTTLKYLSVLTAKISKLLMRLGSLDIKVQRALIQLVEPIVIAAIVFGAVRLQREQGEVALLGLGAGLFFFLLLVTLWVRWAGRDKQRVAPNAIVPAPNSDKKKDKKDRKEKGKYGGIARNFVAGGESTKEGSVFEDEHASVDDLLSDLGSIEQVEDERSVSSASSASSRKIISSESSASVNTEDLGTITNSSSDDEAVAEKRRQQQKSAFEAGVAAGIAAAAGAGVVTVPVTIRSKSTETASTVAPSEGYEKPPVDKPFDDQDLDADFDFTGALPEKGLHEKRGDHPSSGSDSFDSYDPHRRHSKHHRKQDKDSSKSSGSGEAGYGHHLSAIIREHTRDSGKKGPRKGRPGEFKPKRGKKQDKQSAKEAAMRPFKAPVRDKTFKGLTGTYDREMAEITQRAMSTKKSKKVRAGDSDSDIDGSDDEGPPVRKNEGIGLRGAGGEYPEQPDTDKPGPPKKLLYEDFMTSGHDFKMGGVRSMNISQMHKTANLHIHEMIKGKSAGGSRSNTHTSSQVSVTESPPTSDEEEASRRAEAVTIRHATSTPASAGRAGAARQPPVARRASHISPHIRDLGSILGGHRTKSGDPLREDDEESL